MSDERCACGRPLHYAEPAVRRFVERIVAGMGPDVRVEVEGRVWLVPRHYIALHGLKAGELPALAVRFGCPEVDEDQRA